MMSRTSPPPARLSLFLVTLLATTGLLISVSAPTAAAAKPCWERVIDDWIDNDRIDNRYSPACLQASLEHVPEDVRAYSDFEEKIKQAIQESLRFRQLEGSGSGGPSGREAPSVTPAQRRELERLENEESRASQAREQSPIDRALGYRNEDASSIPLPLIILAGLALALMAAGAAGFTRRRLQARRARSS